MNIHETLKLCVECTNEEAARIIFSIPKDIKPTPAQLRMARSALFAYRYGKVK
jgi:hypothetical protein